MIKIKDLWKAYNGKTVLKGVNLEIETGETLVILGRSGAGKSVLLRQIIGLERPDKGTIEVDGVEITNLHERELFQALQSMGMLFQASALFDSLTIRENTAFYLRQHGDPNDGNLSEKEIEKRVLKALDMVGLKGTENLMPSDLSGGMRKRAAMARLIVYRPKILLYDEPTTGLDPITGMQISELIQQIQADLGATSIVVTHDICSAFHVADRLSLSHEGQIKYVTKKSEFVKINDPLVQSFLKNAMPEGIC